MAGASLRLQTSPGRDILGRYNVHIVVTGAAGFIGSHLAERLSQSGHSVRGIDNLSGYYDRHLKQANVDCLRDYGVAVEKRDLATERIDQCLSGAEIVFHLAAQPGLSSDVTFDDYLQNNLIATRRLVDACKMQPSFKFLVHCSTSSVYGRVANASEEAAPAPISHYGVTKLAAEQLVLSEFRQTGFPCCAMRLFSVYGPRERPEKMFHKLISSIMRSEPFPLHEGSGEHRRAFTFVSDVIDAFAACVSRTEKICGQVINIGSEHDASVDEAIAAVEEVVGRTAQIRHVPRRPGDQLATKARIEKAKDLLGFNPRFGLREGVAAQFAWIAGGHQTRREPLIETRNAKRAA
jgi:UDP-glucuronate 4-epimerase